MQDLYTVVYYYLPETHNELLKFGSTIKLSEIFILYFLINSYRFAQAVK